MNQFCGSIFAYRIVDIGHEVDLVLAKKSLSSVVKSDIFQFRRATKTVIIEEKPLIFYMETLEIDHDNRRYHAQVVAKLWSFGALSVCFQIDVPQSLGESELLSLANFLSGDETLDRITNKYVSYLIDQIGNAIKKPMVWDQSEEYLIFIETTSNRDDVRKKVQELIKGEFLYQLLSLEDKEKLSSQMKAPIVESTIQYSDADLVAIDWDSSYVISENDAHDICDVIEFANIQLLELRYFDNLLDKKINHLFKEIMSASPGVFNQSYQRLNREASRLYLDTLEVVERVENSLKVIGDIYYARVYRIALNRLKINDWRSTIDRKLKSILDICEMNKAEIEGKRSVVLEIIIIVLIAIEVIPFLYKLI